MIKLTAFRILHCGPLKLLKSHFSGRRLPYSDAKVLPVRNRLKIKHIRGDIRGDGVFMWGEGEVSIVPGGQFRGAQTVRKKRQVFSSIFNNLYNF